MPEHTQAPSRMLPRIAGIFRGAWRELAVPTEKRNPFLDGLRAIAILLVMNGHVAHAFTKSFSSNAYTKFPLTTDGWMGVDLFFVLSGFFIGGQLWRELDKSETISFPRFIVRRGLRIWPLYFFVLLAMIVLYPAIAAERHYGWSDALFVTNYVYGPDGLVNGSWSLCAEEQFYILAPLLLLAIGRRSSTTWRWILGGLLALEGVFRMYKFHSLTGHLFVRNEAAMQVLYFPLHTHSDGLIAGLLVANFVAYRDKITNRALPWLAIAFGLLILASSVVLHMEYLSFSGLAFFFGGLVWLSTQRSINIFNGHIFYVLSRLSFGMYLNHECVQWWFTGHPVHKLGLIHLGGPLAAIATFAIVTVLSVGVSAITFCLVEHPFLVLRTALLGRKLVKAGDAAPLVAH